jgi:hypothetical protein
MAANIEGNGHKPARSNSRSKWTVMVYLAGDNNLTSNCITVLQQLEAVKYRRDITVLACFDSNTPWPKGSRYLAINGKWRKNNKYFDWEIYNDLIVPRDRDHQITAPDLCDYRKPKGRRMNRTDVAEGLKRFLFWAMRKQRRSDHYMLVLYGHGPVVAGNTFLVRENPVSSLNMTDLPKLLEPHFGGRKQKLDILAFQNCAMNGVETAYEVKDQVKYLIGSQGLVLSYGWPYEKIIGALVDKPNDLPLNITKKILKACARHLIDFSVMDRSSEQSVCDLSKLRNRDNITDAVRELGGELRKALQFTTGRKPKVLEYPVICDAVRLARLEAQTFWGETFVDVYDFCERLLKKCNQAIRVNYELMRNLKVDGALVAPDDILESGIRKTEVVQHLRRIIECCRRVMKRVKEMVPYSYYIGSDLQYSRGLSIYFPWSMPGVPYSFYYRKAQKEHVLVTAFETYSRYSFVEDSEWADFLKVFYLATLRKVRRADREFIMRDASESLALGVVREDITAPAYVLTTEFMRKTDSTSGDVDYDVWSNVKNYPGRNYVSPSDCPLTVDTQGRHRQGKGRYRNRNSPPISYLGWNICEFVADVIARKPAIRKSVNGQQSGSSLQKTVLPPLPIQPVQSLRVRRRP